MLLSKIATEKKTPVLDDIVDTHLKKPMLSGKDDKPSQLPPSFDDDVYVRAFDTKEVYN